MHLPVQGFMKKCQEVSFKVLSCFALGLGFDEDFFTKVGLLQTLHQTINGKASQVVVTLGCNGVCIPYRLTSAHITYNSPGL